MKMKAVEIVLAGVVLLLTSAIASGYINLPYAPLSSPVAVGVCVVASLGAFMVSPVVGLSLFLLTAVLFFKRNVDRTLNQSTTYGDQSILTVGSNGSNPYSSQSSGPRNYEQFQETNPSNPMLGPKVENFEAAPYDEEDSEIPAYGQFPKNKPRPLSVAKPVDYTYRPDADTGDNTFARFGPDLDEKKMTLLY